MPSTKKVVVVLVLLACLTLWRNIQLAVLESSTAFDQYSTLGHNGPLPSASNISSSDGIHTPNATLAGAFGGVAPNRLIHWTMFGVGHRLIRATAAWHLAQRLGIPVLKCQWQTCGQDNTKGTSIFPYLFGSDELAVPRNRMNATTNYHSGKNMLVRNDVYGYLPAQTFQDHYIPLDGKAYKHPQGPFLSKLASDVEFYRQLRDRFAFRDEVEQFMTQHDFSEHHVIGIHLRAGNGEQKHFIQAGRDIGNETNFVLNLVDVVHQFLEDDRKLAMEKSESTVKPPLIFLATDTASLVPVFANATLAFNVSTVVLPQIRVADNKGVTYSALKGAGEKCLLGWRAMVTDMILLSESDVLIAARHSTFTQSMPLSLLLDRKKQHRQPNFCEVSTSATAMTCFQDLPTWLFRDDPSKVWNFVTTLSSKVNPKEVRHKAVVQLPEVDLPKEFAHAVNFLNEPSTLGNVDGPRIHTYGQNKFNPKYRNRKPVEQPGWNFQ